MGKTRILRSVRLLVAGVCLLIAALAIALYREQPQPKHPYRQPAPVLSDHASVPAAIRALRPKYPYSVIPGGVYAPQELRAAIKSDQAVAEHYADFDCARTRLVTLNTDVYRYVSYRVGNRVYWTRKKLRIPKGEVLLTDSRNFGRTRCGNRLAEIPLGPVSPSEPLAADLSGPSLTLADLSKPGVQFAPAPTEGAIPSPALPLSFFLVPNLGNVSMTTSTGSSMRAPSVTETLPEYAPIILNASHPAMPTTPTLGAPPPPPTPGKNNPPPMPVAVPEPNPTILSVAGLFALLYSARRAQMAIFRTARS